MLGWIKHRSLEKIIVQDYSFYTTKELANRINLELRNLFTWETIYGCSLATNSRTLNEGRTKLLNVVLFKDEKPLLQLSFASNKHNLLESIDLYSFFVNDTVSTYFYQHYGSNLLSRKIKDPYAFEAFQTIKKFRLKAITESL